MFSQHHLQFLSVALPALATACIPSFIAPSFTYKFILFGLLLWLGREVRLFTGEYLIASQARACGARLAPRIHSGLPFGLSFLLYRLHILRSGTPDMATKPFDDFPKDTKVIRNRCLGTETFLTRSHLDAKHILTTGFAKWGKSPNLKQAGKPLLGEGIFVTDQRGSWSFHRALTRPHFSRERVADIDACLEHADRVIIWLEEKTEIQKAIDIQDGMFSKLAQIRNSENSLIILDILLAIPLVVRHLIGQVFSRFTLTVGTQHIFGYCVDELNDLFADRKGEAGSIDAKHFSRDFSDAQKRALQLFLLPAGLTRFLQNILPDKALVSVFKVVDGLMAKTEEKDGPEIDDNKSEHLIEQLRRSGCSADVIRYEALNILLAARDTTSSLLTSCIYELAGRDDIWMKLRNEVSKVQGSSMSLENIRELKFLRAVINEALRLHPSVWMNFRHAYEDDVLPSGIFVPAGSNCEYFIQDFQRNPEVWGDDAASFDPERWLDSRRAILSQDPFCFQPFSAGARICLGQQFAYTEVSIMLMRLVRSFSRVELMKSKDRIEEVPAVNLRVRGGLSVKFHK